MAFFYCDYKNPQTHDPLLILGSLARQLIVQDERGIAQLSEFIKDHIANDGSSRNHTPEELCELIRKLSKHSQSALIIVDGLDEIANDRAHVAKLLGSLNTTDGLIKTLFASRPEIDIGYQLEDYLQISIAAMSSDLRLYVASEIERRTRERKLRIQDPSLKEHIMKTLVDGADGMYVLNLLAKISQTDILSRFRWVTCQMDYICECNNDRDRREALRKLPPDLPSSYERILVRANRSNKENQGLVKKVLHWIVYAVDPIPTDQLLQALAVREGEELFDPSAMTTEEELLHLCSSLVRRNGTSGQLELAHFTVKEFLQSIELKKKPIFRKYWLSGDHTVLAKACLGFLRCRKFGELPAPKAETTSNEFWDQWLGISRAYSFVNYCCRHWTHHVHESKWDKVEIHVWKVFDSIDVLNFWTSGWKRICLSMNETWSHYEQHLVPTSLHWAAIFALDKLCPKLIADGLDVSQPSAMGTPLHCTILAEQAPESITRTSESINELQGLSELDSWRLDARESVLQQLIDAGANVEALRRCEGDDWTPLELALYVDEIPYSEPFLSELLVEAGARFTRNCFPTLLNQFEEMKDPSFHHWELAWRPGEELCGLTVTEVFTAAFENSIELQELQCQADAISLALYLACSGGLSDLAQEKFHINFSKIIQGIEGENLDRMLTDNDSEWGVKLITALSTAIRIVSSTAEEALQTLQFALDLAVNGRRAAEVAILLRLKNGLDASHVFGGDRGDYDSGTPLHFLLRYYSHRSKDNEYTKSQLSTVGAILEYGADSIVTVLDVEGASPIEIAARRWDICTFQLCWNSATSSNFLDNSPIFVEKILGSAISAKNHSIIEFLVQELAVKKVVPSFSISLELGVRLTSIELLEIILDQNRCRRNEGSDSSSEDSMSKIKDESGREGPLTAAHEVELEALHLASLAQGSFEAFDLLAQREFRNSPQPHSGNTALHILSRIHDDSSFKKLERLLELNPRLDPLNRNHLTPLALTVR
jgi:ankyrin repeat protein